jgi:hypothetical protein
MPERTAQSALIRRDGGPLLNAILDTPRLAELVPRLPPETLHAAIEQSGLEACGVVLALATPAQLAHVLDMDLWRRPAAGVEEGFDAERFGVWVEVLVEQGADVAARIVAGLDVDLVAAGLAQHVRIFDIATLEAYVTTDGTEIPAVIERDGGVGCDIAGRRLIPRRLDAWDAIVLVLAELAASHLGAFAGLMRACSALANSRREVDGLDALLTGADQAMFDLADARAQRREALGFATPASARAFLDLSRRRRLEAAPVAPIAATAAPEAAPTPIKEAPSAAVVPLAPGSRGAPLAMHLQVVLDRDVAIHATRQQEMAWLANALVAGCTLGGRAFTPQEAADAVVATCSLGIECWPGQTGVQAAPDDLLVHVGLVAVFQVGWTVLYDEVCASATGSLVDALAALPSHDAETHGDLETLRATLIRQWRAGTPWQAGDALDVLASLDLPAFVTLQALIAECPVLPATIDPAAPRSRHRLDPTAFAFIAERRQLAAVRDFLDTLPNLLIPSGRRGSTGPGRRRT